MSEKIKYRFLLDGLEVFPVVGNGFGYTWEKEEGSFYFRKKLNSKIDFKNVDFDTIYDASITTLFLLTIQKEVDEAWEDNFKGKFYKTDCEFNVDTSVATVKPLPDDGFEDIKKVLNNEYDLIKLNPATTAVTYRLQPILQIFTVFVFGAQPYGRGNKITNISGMSYWEETLDRDYQPEEMAAFGFDGPPVTTAGTYFYKRYLTAEETFDGSSTTPRVENDISSIASYFDRTSTENLPGNTTGGVVPNPTRFGRAPNCGDGLSYWRDKLTEDTFAGVNFPVNPSTAWGNVVGPTFENGCSSWWSKRDATRVDFENINATAVEVTDAYELSDMIQLLLSQETNIVHNNTTDYSEFLYSATDPIAGEEVNIILTPRSNIINAFYTNPARRTNIRLSEIMAMLGASMYLGWHVEEVGGEKRLRIEHINWYENGGTYGSQSISIDLTQSLDARTSKVQSFKQNKVSYLKSNMPQRFEFTWSSDASDFFESENIRILDNEINDGTIVRLAPDSFLPDLNTIVGRTDISLDGWVVLSTGVINNDHYVRFYAIELREGELYNIQNGFLSYRILNPLYYKYGMPALNIEVNGETTTALSVTRNKQQEVVFQYSDEINPLNLITTEIGSGQVDKLELNIISNTYKATINHDTE